MGFGEAKFPFRLREGLGEGLSLPNLAFRHPLPRPLPQAEGEKKDHRARPLSAATQLASSIGRPSRWRASTWVTTGSPRLCG